MGEIEKAVLIWMSEGETGLSSMSLARETAGLPHPTKGSFGGIWAPSDPADLRRCRLLIEAVPEARQAVDRLAEKHDGWRGLAADWNEINRLYDEEAATGWKNDAHPTYRAMKKALSQ